MHVSVCGFLGLFGRIFIFSDRFWFLVLGRLSVGYSVGFYFRVGVRFLFLVRVTVWANGWTIVSFGWAWRSAADALLSSSLLVPQGFPLID